MSFAASAMVAERDHLRGEHAGVCRAGLADRHRRHRHARRHLHGRQQRVHALQRGRIDRHADHRTRRVRGDDARQMRGGAGADDEDLHAALMRFVDQAHHARGRPMRGGHRHLPRDAEFVQHRRRPPP